MATDSRVRTGLTLEEFLRRPDLGEKPHLEYIDGRIEAKVAAFKTHSVLQDEMAASLNGFARPRGLGRAFPELRCTFAGRSIIPNVTFLLDDYIALDERGMYADETPIPPDLHIKILSPDRREKKTREKMIHSTANGCPLGWMIHPDGLTIHVFRPGREPELLPPDGVQDGAPVLPGFLLRVSEVFDWLVVRRPPPPGGTG